MASVMPAANRPAFYANIVNLRVTQNEVVLEFGSHFPDKPGPPGPGHVPDVKVVLNRSVLPELARIMTAAANGMTPPAKEDTKQ